MGTSLLNFDWWLLVIVPAAVTIAVNYIQRGLDFTAKNFLPSLKRRRLRYEIKDTLRILRRMSDGTVQYTISSHAAVLAIRGTLTIGTVILLTVAFDLHIRERGWLPTAGIIVTEALMIRAFMRLNRLITLISRYNRTYNYPVETVQTLRLKQSTILGDEFRDELQGAEMLATRLMAARIQQMRDTLGEFGRDRLEPLFMRDYEIEGGLRPE